MHLPHHCSDTGIKRAALGERMRRRRETVGAKNEASMAVVIRCDLTCGANMNAGAGTDNSDDVVDGDYKEV